MESPLSFIDEASDNPRNNRRAPRVPLRLDVELQLPGQTKRYQTRDISYLGIFIECAEPLPLKKLVRFRTTLEGQEEPLQMLGLVAHRINSTDAQETSRTAGMGLQLFALGHEVRSTWRHFLKEEYSKDQHISEAIRQAEYPRLKMRFGDVDQVDTFAHKHVSAGNVFVHSADLYPQGTRIWLDVIHPQRRDICQVEAIVMEFVETPRANRGVRIMFPNSERAKAKLLEFL